MILTNPLNKDWVIVCDIMGNWIILAKITHCHFLVTIFLQNRTTDFDETLHVAWVYLCEGFGNSGRSGYSPVQKSILNGR